MVRRMINAIRQRIARKKAPAFARGRDALERVMNPPLDRHGKESFIPKSVYMEAKRFAAGRPRIAARIIQRWETLPSGTRVHTGADFFWPLKDIILEIKKTGQPRALAKKSG